MPQSFMQSKPTCSTCPFFHRIPGANVGDPGECHHGRATPFPVGQNRQGGMQIMGLRPPTTHDATCSDHPRMREWLQRHYSGDAAGGAAEATQEESDGDRDRDRVPDAYERESAHTREAVADESTRSDGPIKLERRTEGPRIIVK